MIVVFSHLRLFHNKSTVKSCKVQKRALIVLEHPPDLIGHPKAHGNAQLISEKRADIVFENDYLSRLYN
ncbi:MAG: hypothetical protein C5S38_09310 [Candidatus Methanophagaceae archaeon]|nr:MAG: hypothetical protein C5S38_09310 [Methanophagales archaeon]KAF5429762.1 hypothetical protein C5S36_14765 [Methanophagales archaeon]